MKELQMKVAVKSTLFCSLTLAKTRMEFKIFRFLRV